MLYFILFLQILTFIVPIHYVNEELQPYYNEFFTYVDSKCKKEQINVPSQIVVDFGPMMSEGDIGYCIAIDGIRFKINIDKDYFIRSNEEQKFNLMVHELSHCVLSQKHSEDSRHYMYYMENGLSKEATIIQLKQVIEGICDK